jgi:hypothetical protein
MRTEQYNYIYKNLNRYDDIAKLSRKLRLPKELLLVIYTQRTIRKASKDFYKMKNRLRTLTDMWKSGTTFVQIANKYEFPPVLTAYLILTQSSEYSKKGYRRLLFEPDDIKDKRLKREIKEVVKQDRIYSPKGSEVQKLRGIKGEDAIQKWLEKKGIDFRTEEDLRGEFPKTPDFLFDEPIFHRGSEVFWIESKASFGDRIEINKTLRKQLVPYIDLFGEGMVLYFFGTIDDYPTVDGILIETQDFFKDYRE